MKSGIKLLLLSLLLIAGCKASYNFNGASIPPEVKTVSIQNFPNYAPTVQPTLSQAFTEKMKERFLSQTNLKLIDKNGDIDFEGSITGYNVTPVSIQGNDVAAQNRLTITVKIKFTNTKEEKQSFETSFSRFADYSSSQNLSSIESTLIQNINEQLVNDIFNKAVSNW